MLVVCLQNQGGDLVGLLDGRHVQNQAGIGFIMRALSGILDERHVQNLTGIVVRVGAAVIRSVPGQPVYRHLAPIRGLASQLSCLET